MNITKKSISTLVESQLPDFIVNDYNNFSTFLEKYYDHLESQGNPLDIINNITKYTNIDFYEKDLLNQTTKTTQSIDNLQTTINVVDASSFPKNNGYILIDDEICFYKERNNNTFFEVTRGVSGNIVLGDLYNKSSFVTTLSDNHYAGSTVLNVSNLFLYALIRNFEVQYLNGIPEKYLKPELDKKFLIKNIGDFYRSKGTKNSIKFIFNSIVSQDPTEKVDVYNPKDYTLKSSVSDWTTKNSIKINLISGNINKLIGEKIIQSSSDHYASAVVENIIYSGSNNEYELILAPNSIIGNFKVISRTLLKSPINVNDSVGSRVTVESTFSWPNSGKFLVNSEIISYSDKNVNQFVIESRNSPNTNHSVNTAIYSLDVIDSVYNFERIIFAITGVVYDLIPDKQLPYSSEGDEIQIKSNNFSSHPIINKANWKVNENYSFVSTGIAELSSVLKDISAIYEDDDFVYICSSGYSSAFSFGTNQGFTLKDQKNLKLIKKHPSTTTEIYKTSNRDVGVLVDGSVIFSYKDFDFLKYGKIEEIKVTSKGIGYKNSPYVLVNGIPGKAKAVLSGEVLDYITIETDEIFNADPEITIISGRNATVKPIITNGEITSIEVENPGEYYSSPPVISIRDLNGRGAFAEYQSVISNDGKLIKCERINGGRFYNLSTVLVEVIPVGSNAFAEANIKRWVKNRYNKLNQVFDVNNGYFFKNFNDNFEYGYGIVANPRKLRYILSDNINSVFEENLSSFNHSPIIGYAYDGNPIYGPYGYSDPLNKNSSIARMNSGYVLSNNRLNGPTISEYPLGTFLDDYVWQANVNSGKTYLDKNNGRFCITPEYPNGVYAYFVTIDNNSTPVFPYIIGENFYSVPTSLNYDSDISQDKIPSNVKRILFNQNILNGQKSTAIVKNVLGGNLSGVNLKSNSPYFSVGSDVYIDNYNTEGRFAKAKVSEVTGKQVVDIISSNSNCIQLSVDKNTYFFKNDLVYQGIEPLSFQIIVENTTISEFTISTSPNIKVVNDLKIDVNASLKVILDVESEESVFGEVLSDVNDSNILVLKNVQGKFDANKKLSSSIEVINLILDRSCTYTEGAILTLKNKDNQEYASGLVLSGTDRQNSVKLKVLSGIFFSDDNYFIKSSVITDTFIAKVFQYSYISNNLSIVEVDNNIAILTTQTDHKLAVDDIVDIDLIPSNSSLTEYYVRKKLFQNVEFKPIDFSYKINDTGIGRTLILNSGEAYQAGIFQNRELIFQDSSSARRNIGLPGDSGNAKATVSVSNNGSVISVEITNKGKGYQVGDILTISDSSLNRSSTTLSTFRIVLYVDHVGFSKENTILTLNQVTNISNNDQIKIGDEILLVKSVNTSTKKITVERGQKNTTITDYPNNQEVIPHEVVYNFGSNYYPLGSDAGKPKLFSFDKVSNSAIFEFGYNATDEFKLSENSILRDQSVPNKLISFKNVSDPKFKLEFSKDNINFSINPIIEVQNRYKYRFNTSHSSMVNTYLDFSPSINKNIITLEKFKSSVLPGSTGSYLEVKFGFGLNLNNQNIAENTKFSQYFYFVNGDDRVDTENAYLDVIADPLIGRKNITFVTDKDFVYNIDKIPQFDGNGTMSYSTTSSFAVGKIKNISITSAGENYKKIPRCLGVLPNENYECTVDVVYNSIDQKIEYIKILNQGLNYSKPVALVTDGDGIDYEFNCIVENGKVKNIEVLNGGKGFTYKPSIKIYESDLEVYFTSKNIGIPSVVQIYDNGNFYTNDTTTLPNFSSNLTLELNYIDTPSYYDGEILYQYENGSITASGIVCKDGWKKYTNLLKIKVLTGVFKTESLIKTKISKKSASIKNIYYSSFTPNIKSTITNKGEYNSEKGKLNSNEQRISDSYFYQDYSYVIKSKTPISKWRDLIKNSTHPAGFNLFGEVLIESSGNNSMPVSQEHLESTTIINLEPKLIGISDDVKKTVTEAFVSLNALNVERGLGSIYVNYDLAEESVSTEFKLHKEFNGYYNNSTGKLVGDVVFTMIDTYTNLPFSPSKEEHLFVTIDGVLQEPKKSFVTAGNKIIFSSPPLGEVVSEGQIVPGQKFYGKSISYKDQNLNANKIKKIQDISEYFDGKKVEFDLYYEEYENESTIVKSANNENFIVCLNGVLQKAKNSPLVPYGNSYYISRSTNPNVTDKIVFSSPPIAHQSLYDSVQDKVAVQSKENSFIIYYPGYKRLKIDNKTINSYLNGPYLLFDESNNRIVNVDDQKFCLVFIDGVLQIPGKSYDIFGSVIVFNGELRSFVNESGEYTTNDVSILYFYGRDTEYALTIHDHDPYNFNLQSTIALQGSFDTYSSDTLSDWYDGRQNHTLTLEYNNKFIGTIKSISFSGNTIQILLLSKMFYEIGSNSYTIKDLSVESDFIISGDYSYNLSYLKDTDNNIKLVRDSSNSNFGTENGILEYESRAKLLSPLMSGDKILVDGEQSYRNVLDLPNFAKTKNYNLYQPSTSEIYSKLKASNYNGIVEGEGLSIRTEINKEGVVTDLIWNRRDLELYFNKKILTQSTTTKYFITPKVTFVQKDSNGGGAEAKVIIFNGDIIDVVLINGGYGYTDPPIGYVTRGYNIIKNLNRKSQSFVDRYNNSNITYAESLDIYSIININAPQEGIYPLGFGYTHQFESTENLNTSIEKNIQSISPIVPINLNPKTLTKEVSYFTDVQSNILFDSKQETTNQIFKVIYKDLMKVGKEVMIKSSAISTKISSTKANESQVCYATILDAPIDVNDTIIYVQNTKNFPDSGIILIGREFIYYEGKQTDRLFGIQRGYNNSLIEQHFAGELLKSLV